MSRLTIYVGSDVTLEGTFKAKDGSLVDPASVWVTVECEVTGKTVKLIGGDITRESVGVYTASYITTAAGRHEWRWESSGGTVAVGQGYFDVEERNVASP